MYGDNRDVRGDSYNDSHLRSSQGDYRTNATNNAEEKYWESKKKSTPSVIQEQPKPKNITEDTTWSVVHLFLYVFFVTIVYIITSGTRNHERYYLSKVIYELFIDKEFEGYGGAPTTFRQSSTINDFWGFTDHMSEGLYRSKWYWGHSPDNGIHLVKTSNLEGEKYDTKIVGRARLRQIRVKKATCPIQKYFFLLSRTCYPEYEESHEDMSIINDEYGNKDPYAGWTYSKHEELNSIKYFGSLGVYSSAGYSVILDTNEEETRTILTPLKNHIWITRSTRAILLDFTFYNSNIDIFCVVRLVWEMPSTGGVSTSWNIQTVQYMKYETRYEKFVFACQIIFMVFTLFYFVEEIYFLVTTGWRKYFTNFWTYVSFIMLGLSIFCVVHTIRRYLLLSEILQKDISTNSKEDVGIFHELALWEGIYNSAVSSGVGLMWISLLKHLHFITPMSKLFLTMRTCAKDVGGFGILFLIVFFSFTQLGHFVFGNQVLAFSTLGRSIFTLLAFVLGYFDYQSIVDANRFIGPIFYATFLVFVFMILINMFLAIVNLSYHTVMEQTTPFQEPRRCYCKCCKCCKCCCKDKRKGVSDEENVTANNIFINPAEIKLELQRNEFSEVDIAMFFNRFDIQDSTLLDVDESHRLLSDVTANSFTSRNETFVTHTVRRKSHMEKPLPLPPNTSLESVEHFNLLHRLGAIETAVIEIVPRFDSLVTNMELFIKKKQRENLLKYH